jgi:hypothetical protein
MTLSKLQLTPYEVFQHTGTTGRETLTLIRSSEKLLHFHRFFSYVSVTRGPQGEGEHVEKLLPFKGKPVNALDSGLGPSLAVWTRFPNPAASPFWSTARGETGR